MFKNNKQYIKDNLVNKKNKLNILIIEENESKILIFKNILESRGHIVTVINEVINCVNIILTNNYDIIFFNCNNYKIADTLLTDLIVNVLHYKALIFGYIDDYKNIIDKENKKLGVNGIILISNKEKINKIISIIETIEIINKKDIDNSIILLNKKINY